MAVKQASPGGIKSPRKQSYQQTLIAYAVLIFGTLFVYLPTLAGDFIWDDDFHVTDNIPLRSVQGLAWIWTHLGATPQYYPLTHTTFWIQYQLSGADPFPYHFVNILLHIGSSIALWHVLGRLGVRGAYFAALLFAWHPVHVESVAWISERKNTLSGFFYLLAAICAVRAFHLDISTDASHPTHRRWYAAMLLCAIAALLSKTVTSTFPAALMVVAWWKRGRIDWRMALWLTPLWIAAGVFGRITAYMEKHIVGAVGPEWQIPFIDRVLIASRAVLFYAGKLLVPIDLSFIYTRWKIDSTSFIQWLFPLTLLLTLGVLIALRKRTGNGPLAAMLFFIGTLFPALGFIDVFPMVYSFVADHFQYLASIGLLTLGASITVRLLNVRTIRVDFGTIVCSAIGGTLLVLTFQRTRVFESSATLWSDVLAKDRSSLIARVHLGDMRQSEGDLKGAESLYREALAIQANHADSAMGLAQLLQRRGDRAQAVTLLRNAAAASPNNAMLRLRLGEVLQYDQPDESVEICRQLLRENPTFEPARMALAKLLALSGQIDTAIAECNRAIELSAQTVQARVLLGDLYLNKGDLQSARVAYRDALKLQPDNPAIQRRMQLERVPKR